MLQRQHWDVPAKLVRPRFLSWLRYVRYTFDPSVIYRKFATPGIFGPKLPFLLPVYVPIALVVILAITRRPLTTKLAVILGVSITAAALVSMSFYMVSQHLAPFAWGWQFPPAVLVQSSVGVLIASQIPRFKTFEEEA